MATRLSLIVRQRVGYDVRVEEGFLVRVGVVEGSAEAPGSRVDGSTGADPILEALGS